MMRLGYSVFITSDRLHTPSLSTHHSHQLLLTLRVAPLFGHLHSSITPIGCSLVAATSSPSHNVGDEEEDDDDISLKVLSKKLKEFAEARDWEKYHTPRNLLFAMVGEVGELSEIFQWKGEVERGLEDWEESEKEHLGEELSDVLLYLIRLADICNIDLAQATLNKILKNAIKYPLPLNSLITKKQSSS